MNSPQNPGMSVNNMLEAVAQQASASLDALEEIPGAVSSLNYFKNVLNSVFVRNDPMSLQDSEAGRKPIIGIYCVLVPEELIYAAGAIPIRLCAGCFDIVKMSEDFMPRDSCPLVKSSMGLSVNGGLKIFDLCDVVIIPTTCDSKRKLGEELSAHKPVWMLEVPHIKDMEFSKQIWLEQVWALKAKLESFRTPDGRACRKITAKRLGEAVKNALAAQREVRRLLDLRKLDNPPIWGRQAAAVTNAYAYAPVRDWADHLGSLNDQLSETMNTGVSLHKKKPRIFVAGSPVIFPNLKIYELVEEMGGVVVADESCAGDRYLYDPVGHTEPNLTDQMTAIASRYLSPCICPSFSPNADRLTMIRRNVKDYAIEGVVYHVLKGCIIYDFEVNRVATLLKEYGIPLLRVETDYHPEDIEQLRTRIEAFLEMIKSRKNSKSHKGMK